MDALSTTSWQMCMRFMRPLRSRVLMILGACLLLAGITTLLGTWLMPSVSATARHVASSPVAHTTATGPDFLYLDNGTCPNSINGFQITNGGLVATPGSPYTTHACQGKPTLGANQIATDSANHCVFHTDESAGRVESFSANPSTGQLTGPISSVLVGDKKDNRAGDLHVVAYGGAVYVFVAVWSFRGTGNISTLLEGTSCSLNLTSQLATPKQSYYSILPVVGKNSLSLLAADYANAMIDTYSVNLAAQGALTLQTSTPSQFVEPEGLAVWNNSGSATALIFTGIGDDYNTEAQAGMLTKSTGALTANGTAYAPQNVAGPYVSFWHDSHSQLLIQSDALNNTLAIYSIVNGAPVFQSEVALPGLVTPSAQALAHDTLYVVGDSNGAVDACYLLAHPIVCTQLTTLSSSGVGLPEGVGVLGN